MALNRNYLAAVSVLGFLLAVAPWVHASIELPPGTDASLSARLAKENLAGLGQLAHDALIAVLPGDFDADGRLKAADIDALTRNILEGSIDLQLDVDGDGDLDLQDRVFWIKQLQQTTAGDANLDGQFDSLDLIVTLQLGLFEDQIPRNATWESGDWDGDGDFATADLIAAFQEGVYERGPQAAVSATSTPEPGGLAVVLLSAACWLGWTSLPKLIRR